MFFLSDKLWLTANNSKGFAYRSKLMIRDLGLRKCTEICLIKNIVMDLMLSKYRFGKKRYIKKINDIWKRYHCLVEKGHFWKEWGGSIHSFG